MMRPVFSLEKLERGVRPRNFLLINYSLLLMGAVAGRLHTCMRRRAAEKGQRCLVFSQDSSLSVSLEASTTCTTPVKDIHGWPRVGRLGSNTINANMAILW